MAKAIVLDLGDTDPKLPSEVSSPHLTLLFRKKGYRPDGPELDAVRKLRNEFMASRNSETLTFKLSKWGKSSDLVHGELKDLCIHIRSNMEGMHEDARKPHVALRKSFRSRRRETPSDKARPKSEH